MPRSRKPRKKPTQHGFLYRATRNLMLIGVLGGLVLIAGVAVYYNMLVSRTFDEHRWSSPGRVYAQPLELYPGRALTQAELQLELSRVGYKQATRGTATWQRTGSSIVIRPRTFRFDDDTAQLSEMTIRFEGAHVADLQGPSGQPLPLARLDPPMIGSFYPAHGEDRIVVPPQNIPTLLKQGLIVVEDRNFDSHFGIDPRGILRALWVNLRQGSVEQGASTLTQQLARSYFLDNSQTVSRKLREVIVSLILEWRLDKDEILDAYVNEIYLGQDGDRAIHGFGLAAQFYFNKSLEELDTPELSLLIAIARGPSWYNPYRHPDRALARRQLVLDQLVQFGQLTPEQHRQASRAELQLAGADTRGRYYPAFLDLVRLQLEQTYRPEDLASRGLRIFTTLEPRIQDAAEAALASELARIERNSKVARQLEGAVIVTRAQTGEVVAIVGSRGRGSEGFNRAILARRTAGSIIKPAVYLAAFEKGKANLATPISDAPLTLKSGSGDLWTPTNSDNKSHGEVSTLAALSQSYNLATVRLGLTVGLDEVATMVGRLTNAPPPPSFPSLLLGAVEMSPVTVAQLYSTFASGGFPAEPKSVARVFGEQDQLLTGYSLQLAPAASRSSVIQVNEALILAMTRGTGKHVESYLPDVTIAGKTGTSNDYRDSWFAGFDANYLAVVWVGRDDNQPTGLTGASGALRVWGNLMRRLGPVSIRKPTIAGLAPRWIDYTSGGMAGPSCGDSVEVMLPVDAVLPWMPDCAPSTNPVKKAWQWLTDQVK